MSETAIERREPTTIEIIQQVLAQGGKAAEMAAVVKELVALKQSEERFAWEREERQAKIDFDDALNRCQSAIGRIAPNDKRDRGIEWLNYAGADRVMRPIYSGERFSISYSEIPASAPNRMKMKAVLSRCGIIREFERELSVKSNTPDEEEATASRIQRYLLFRIFNIAVGIDKEEKEPFRASPEDLVDENLALDYLSSIEGAGDVDELQAQYFRARDAAVKDPLTLKRFAEAKNKRYRQLTRSA